METKKQTIRKASTKTKYKGVSKFLGVNQEMESFNAIIGYLALGVIVGLYSGTSLISKARRVVIFGVGFPLGATIIGGVADNIIDKVKN